jgi:hypothetical protein
MQNPAAQLTTIMGQQCITSLSVAENALNLTAGGAIGVAGFSTNGKNLEALH